MAELAERQFAARKRHAVIKETAPRTDFMPESLEWAHPTYSLSKNSFFLIRFTHSDGVWTFSLGFLV